MSRISRALLGLAAAALTTAAALAVPASAQASTACDAALVAPEGSLIGGFWRSNGGERSVFRCPVTKEFGFPDKRGSWQKFANGTIVWSPNLGNATLVRAFSKGEDVVLKWSGLSRDWDYFNVRWNMDGGGATQVRVGRLTPFSGTYAMAANHSGGVGTTTNGDQRRTFTFIVQGCDRGTFSSDCGAWTIPTSIRLAH